MPLGGLDIQNFVLDFETLDNLGSVAGHSQNLDDYSNGAATASQTSRTGLRLRIYRRLGSTAVISGLQKLSVSVTSTALLPSPADAEIENENERRETTASDLATPILQQASLSRTSPYDVAVG